MHETGPASGGRHLALRQPGLTRLLRVLVLGSLVCLASVGLVPVGRATEGPAAVTIDAQPLLAGNVGPGEWAAVRVHVENEGPAVRGELRISTSDQAASSYGLEVELPTGARQDHVIYGRSGPFGLRATVSLVSDGTVVASVKAVGRAARTDGPGVYLVAERPDRLVGDIRASFDPAQNAEVFAIGVEDLPPRVEAWSAVDHLVWQDVPADRLDAARLEALAAWVALGGHLTIVGGPSGAGVIEALPDELVPFRPERTIDVPLVDLEALLGDLPADATPLPAFAGRLDRGTLLAESGGLAIAARARYGQGSVTLLGIDPSAPWLTSTPVSSALWERIWAAAIPFERPGPVVRNQDMLLDALSYLPSVTTPRMEHLLLWLLGYLALLGPVNYLVLRRLDRREWAWVTIPALAILFTGGALVLGLAFRGTRVVVNELSIVQGAAGSDRGVADVFVGIFTPNRATFDVRLRGAALVSQPTPEWQGQKPLPLDVLQGDPARVRGFGVGYGALRGLRARVAVRTPRIEASLRLVDGHVRGTLTNMSGETLEHSVFVSGGAMQVLGALGVGETRDVDVAVGRPGRTMPSAIAELAGVAGDATAGSARGLASRVAIIRALADEWWWDDGTVTAPLVDLGPMVLAWRTGATLAVDVGTAADQVGDTAYLLPVRVAVSGPVSITGGLIRPTVLDVSAAGSEEAPEGFYLAMGTMVVDYHPVGLEAQMRVTGLALRIDERGQPPTESATDVLAPLAESQQPDQEDPMGTGPVDARGGTGWGAIRVQLRDRATGRWVEFEELRPGRSYRIQDAPRFVDASGSLRARFVSRGSDPPMFGLGLRVEGVAP